MNFFGTDGIRGKYNDFLTNGIAYALGKVIAHENEECMVVIGRDTRESDGEYFLLRAQGESMINIGIEPGDLVLIRKQSYADPGQVAVVISTEFSDAGGTLKRYYPEPEKHRVRLHPENDTMKDFFVRECIVQGVAKRVFKMRNIE